MLSSWPPDIVEVAAAITVLHFSKKAVDWSIEHKPQIDQWIYDQYYERISWSFAPNVSQPTPVTIEAEIVGHTIDGHVPILRMDP